MLKIFKVIANIDFLGDQIYFTVEGKKRTQTQFGGWLTIGIIIFMIYAVAYFGSEIIQKAKPISRNTKFFSNSSINIRDLPLIINVSDRNGELITNIDKYISLKARFAKTEIDKNNVTIWPQAFGYLERCNISSINTKYHHLFRNKQGEGIIENSYCLNPLNLVWQNGTSEDSSFNIMNDWGSTPSAFASIMLENCKGSNCYSDDIRLPMLDEIYIIFYFINSYVDINDYEEPQKIFLDSRAQMASRKTFKRTWLRFQKVVMYTDTGSIMEDINTKESFKLDSSYTDSFNPTDVLFELTFESPNLQEHVYRHYYKLQDLLANLGGLFKFLVVVGEILVEFYSKATFEFSIINKHFSLQTNTTNTLCSNSNVIMINNLVEHTSGKDSNMNYQQPKFIKNLKTNTIDYLNSLVCKNKSGITKNQYTVLREYVAERLNISNYFKTINEFKHLVEIILKDQEYVLSSKYHIKEQPNIDVDFRDEELEKIRNKLALKMRNKLNDE